VNKYKIGFFVLLGLLGFTMYANYDYRVFKALIAQNYMPKDALEELYSRHIAAENRRGFSRDFDRMVIAVVTSELSEISQDQYTYLYAPQEFQASVAADRAAARTAKFYALDENTAYLYIPNISRLTRMFVHTNREELAQFSNLVLDLRGNYGGWLSEFHRIADLFVPNGAVISHEITRHSMLTRAVTSTNDAFFDFDQIIILQNRNTASAAEGLIMALSEHLPNVTTIGQTSFGKGTGQVTLPLTGGSAVRATILQVLGPVRQDIHNVGLAPDIEIDIAADFIAEALAQIQPFSP